MAVSSQRPELETRRAMLTQMRDSFRAQGFEAEMNVTALKVQIVQGEEESQALAKMIADYEGKARNCYRSAEGLSAELAKLPKPKKEKPAA